MARPASAQTTGTGTTTNATLSLAKTGVTIDRKTERGEAEFPFYLSRRDCVEDATFHFALAVKGLTSARSKTLQMWVSDPGADCSSATVRNSEGQCGLVAQVSNPNNLTQFDIEASAQDIVRAYSRKPTDAPAEGKVADCDEEIQNNVVFQFFLVEGTTVVSNVATWKDTQIDLVGPNAPIDVKAGIGENKLVLEWDIADGDDSSDTQSFAFYCDVSGPAVTEQGAGGLAATGGTGSGLGGLGGGAGAIGVGTGGAGGDDGTATCPPGRLRPGRVPSDFSLQCGSVRGIATRNGNTDRLENFVTYAVAVAAVDQVGNSGKLSKVTCGTPEPVITFFEAYRNAGGQGGGGFCALGAVPAPGALGALALAGVTLIARRRRPRA